jgi:6-phosphofructokinase 1
LVIAIALTAAITHWWTKRQEEEKVFREKKAAYDRELMIKTKTLEARKLTGEPNGHLVQDLSLDRVFLWEVEDLRKRFSSSNVQNKLMNIPMPQCNPYYFPSLKNSKKKELQEKVQPTDYNRLITNHECILAGLVRKPNMPTYTHAYVRAGPRRFCHFEPSKVNSAIVTCGGLCPGLNNVIREIVKTSVQAYGIGGAVYGIQGGYRGFYDFENYHPLELTPELVNNIHHEGGTVLGSSRGGFDLEKTLDFLESKNISQLFVIGGDGTHRGAFRIHEGCMERVSDVIDIYIRTCKRIYVYIYIRFRWFLFHSFMHACINLTFSLFLVSFFAGIECCRCWYPQNH